jgi:hypothetical protein
VREETEEPEERKLKEIDLSRLSGRLRGCQWWNRMPETEARNREIEKEDLDRQSQILAEDLR